MKKRFLEYMLAADLEGYLYGVTGFIDNDDNDDDGDVDDVDDVDGDAADDDNDGDDVLGSRCPLLLT